MESKVKSIDKKNKIRIALAAVILLIAVIFLSRACTLYFTGGEGWEYITVESISPDQNIEYGKIYPYGNRIVLNYYYNENGYKRNQEQYRVEQIYNSVISKVYKYFDSDYTYTENGLQLHNIGYINNHPNETIELDEFLYDTLKSAVNYTYQSNGIYNIYAGNIEQQWNEILEVYKQSLEYRTVDPLYNTLYKNKIEDYSSKITSYYNDKSQGLKFDDTNKTINFVVDDSYVGYIKIDLQILEDAYAMNYIYSNIQNSITRGYLMDYNGMVITLGKYPLEDLNWSANFYGPDARVFSVNVKDGYRSCVFSTYNSFAYSFVLDGEKYKRNLYYNGLTGYQNCDIDSIVVISSIENNESLIDIAYNTLLLMTKSLTEVKEIISNNDCEKLYMFAIEESVDNTVYICVDPKLSIDIPDEYINVLNK